MEEKVSETVNSDVVFEVGFSSLSKFGEELCGDHCEYRRTDDSIIVVLSDGLGSGVKANILAMLTSKIAVTMLEEGASIDEVVETISDTLPICKVRNLAYSTFAILQIKKDGSGYIVQFDTPDAFLLKDNSVVPLLWTQREVGNKKIKECRFKTEIGESFFLVTDGVIHAGIGGILNLGWQWNNLAEYIKNVSGQSKNVHKLTKWVVNVCNQFYAGRPGDDTTVVGISVRNRRKVILAVGPPKDKSDDCVLARELINFDGEKIVCGGSTASIISREIGKKLEVDLKSMHKGIPPMAKLEGVDLVTEGIITLSKALDQLKESFDNGVLSEDIEGDDAVSCLCKKMMEADYIKILVGKAVNPAHQNPDLPINSTWKIRILEDINSLLTSKGKTIEMIFY